MARLYSIANYEIFDEDTHDTYKCTFGLDGTLDGMYFDIYDLKRDDEIHVNYCHKMDYKLFEKTLLELMKNATPKDYVTIPCYGFSSRNDKEIYEWKST